MIARESPHRFPLSITPVLNSESELHAILQSVTMLLSKVIGCDCVALLLLNEDGQTARLYVLDLDSGASTAPIVCDVPIEDAALAEFIKGQKPRYISNIINDLPTIPALIQLTRIEPANRAHVFPVSSA